MNVGDLLTRAARRYGDRLAVVDGDRQVGFRELDDRSDRLAAALLDRGLAPGDRVGVLVGNELEWFDATFGLLKAGMVRTYVNPRSAPPEITFQLEDCDPAAVIVSADHAHLLDKVDLGSVKHVIETGASYEAMLANSVSGRRSMPVEESDLAAIMYSSGTTGRPKGTRQTHGNWLAHTKSALIELNPAADDVILHVGPMGHASGGYAYPMFVRGSAQVLSRGFDPDELVEALPRHQVTTLLLVPTMISMLMDAIERRGVDATSLRTLLYGASPMAPHRIEHCLELLGPVLVQCYGMTEALGGVTYLGKEDHVPGSARLASAGRSATFGELRVVDGDGNDVPAGEVGEVIVRGGHVTSGYWNLPEATAAAIDDAGWYHSNDMAYLDDGDYLFIVDRKADMIISGGYNVFPLEVENALTEHPAVEEAAVVAIPDERWGEAVKAVVRLRDGLSASSDELASWCRARVAGYKVPKSFDFTDQELPRSAVGKLLRRTVREGYWQGSHRQVG